VFVASSMQGLITLVAVVYTWRSRSRVGARIIAGSRILPMIIGLPAFIVDGVPPVVVVVVAVDVVVTVVAVGLVLSRPGRPHQIA
jgi:predicted metallopeptidase